MVHVRVLGVLEVIVDGRAVALGSKERVLLAVQRGPCVTDLLIDDLRPARVKPRSGCCGVAARNGSTHGTAERSRDGGCRVEAVSASGGWRGRVRGAPSPTD